MERRFSRLYAHHGCVAPVNRLRVYTDVLHFHGPIQNENRGDPLREFVTIISIGFDD
jgi:hypothetical protein